MNREIKFRGKRIDNGEWVYGYYAHIHDMNCVYILTKAGLKQRKSGVPFYGKEVDPSTVGQYTGLKDKNGKEIYEGDLMKNYQADINEVYWLGEFALFAMSNYHADSLPLHDYHKKSEIIGNIHQQQTSE